MSVFAAGGRSCWAGDDEAAWRPARRGFLSGCVEVCAGFVVGRETGAGNPAVEQGVFGEFARRCGCAEGVAVAVRGFGMDLGAGGGWWFWFSGGSGEAFSAFGDADEWAEVGGEEVAGVGLFLDREAGAGGAGGVHDGRAAVGEGGVFCAIEARGLGWAGAVIGGYRGARAFLISENDDVRASNLC